MCLLSSPLSGLPDEAAAVAGQAAMQGVTHRDTHRNLGCGAKHQGFY